MLRIKALLMPSILVCLLNVSSRADARGGGTYTHDTWAAAHIEGLPPGIRRSLMKQVPKCGTLRAQHDFSRYLSPTGSKNRFVSLHFEHFGCTDRAAICTDGACLHQVYASSGGAYRLVFSARVQELELKVISGAPAIEIACGRFGENCARILRWTGNRFVRR